jgi:hypothetical protein
MELTMAVKPTPSQAENDRSALGEYIHEHEDDGSGPDPNEQANQQAKNLAAGKPATYQTKTVKPKT